MSLVEGYHLRELRQEDEEFKYINSRMIKTLSVNHKNGIPLGSYEITKVHKVFNSTLWRSYRARREQMYLEMGKSEMVMEKRLFHGTPCAQTISREGFDMSHAKSTGMFGKGLYFAENSSKSVQYAFGLNNGCKKHGDMSCYECPRYMLVCRVALGKMLRVTSAMQTGLPKGYHSIYANPSPGGLAYPEYVIYHKDQAYPGYLVEYKILQQRPSVKARSSKTCN